jgi:hypothetical protein
MLIKRVGMGGDLDQFAAAGDGPLIGLPPPTYRAAAPAYTFAGPLLARMTTAA